MPPAAQRKLAGPGPSGDSPVSGSHLHTGAAGVIGA